MILLSMYIQLDWVFRLDRLNTILLFGIHVFRLDRLNTILLFGIHVFRLDRLNTILLFGVFMNNRETILLSLVLSIHTGPTNDYSYM
jgi:hypothetical protein